MMRCWIKGLVALTLIALWGQEVRGQTNYELEGQPQGGDRRGTYRDITGSPEDETIPLYKDPKTYLHNMTLLASLPQRSAPVSGVNYFFPSH